MKPYLGGVDDKAKDVAIPSQLDDDIYGLARASDIESTTPVADVFRDLRWNLCGSTSIWLVRSEFRRWSHGPFESVLEFRETLHLLGRQAYPALTASDLEETLIDQFINGVSDPDVRNPLLRELHTKFDDALRLTYQEGTLQAVCAPPLRGCVGVASMRSQADVDISTQILGVSALVGSILSDKPTGANRRPAALPVIKLDSLFRLKMGLRNRRGLEENVRPMTIQHSEIPLSNLFVSLSMTERPDPFYVVKDEVIKSLAQANTEYEAWKNEVLSKSVDIKTVETALRQTIRNIEWDLEDLQETVLIVEKNPTKFFISEDELHSRQAFLHNVKVIVRRVKDNLADPRDLNSRRRSVSFEIPAHTTVNGTVYRRAEKNNESTPAHKPGTARPLGLTEQHKTRSNPSTSADSLLFDQRLLLQEQDAHLDQLGNSISRLKDISHRMGGELGDQVALLDTFGEEMTQTESKLDNAMMRAARILHLDSDRSQWWAISVLFLTLLIIIVLLAVL
ncbi:Syntaxin-6 [Sparganum proliferum]